MLDFKLHTDSLPPSARAAATLRRTDKSICHLPVTLSLFHRRRLRRITILLDEGSEPAHGERNAQAHRGKDYWCERLRASASDVQCGLGEARRYQRRLDSRAKGHPEPPWGPPRRRA